ncbi:Uncharacterised protein [Klebsiella pneumoniae]|nr:Uncharacterised protein [Klebsiella pneumoniae]
MLRKAAIIGPAIALRRPLGGLPVHPRGHRAIHLIPVLHQQTRIALVKSPAPGAMANHFGLEGILQQTRHIVDLLTHHSVAVFNKIRLMAPVICSQRLGRRAVPRMQMHADFRGAAGNHVSGEFDIKGVDGHFIVGQIDRFKAILFAKLLKTRKITRILGGDAVMFLPEVIALCINRDEKCGIVHENVLRPYVSGHGRAIQRFSQSV